MLMKTGILYFTTCFHGFGILRHVDPFVRMLHIYGHDDVCSINDCYVCDNLTLFGLHINSFCVPLLAYLPRNTVLFAILNKLSTGLNNTVLLMNFRPFLINKL